VVVEREVSGGADNDDGTRLVRLPAEKPERDERPQSIGISASARSFDPKLIPTAGSPCIWSERRISSASSRSTAQARSIPCSTREPAIVAAVTTANEPWTCTLCGVSTTVTPGCESEKRRASSSKASLVGEPSTNAGSP